MKVQNINNQQTFGLKINTESLVKENAIQAYLPLLNYKYEEKAQEIIGAYKETPQEVINAIESCKNAIARIKPKDKTIKFRRSSHTTGFNHLEVRLGDIYRTVTDDIFNLSGDLNEAIMGTVKETSKLFLDNKKAQQKKISFIPTIFRGKKAK